MKNFILIACAAVLCSLTNGQSQSAFDSFMSRNRELFPNIGSYGSQEPQGLRSSYARSFPLNSNFVSEQSPPSYITSNSHIQAFNPSPASTTVPGPNFATYSAPSTGAAYQSFMSQRSPNFASQPVQNYQPQPIQSFQSQPIQRFQSQPIQSYQSQPIQSFPSQPTQRFQSQPIQSFQSLPAPQTYQNLQQSGQQLPAQNSEQNFGFQSGLKAQGLGQGEAQFVFMRRSESPQGAALRKVVRGENGIEKEIYYVPMQNYAPPTVFNYQTVHQIPGKPGQSANQ